MDGDDSTSNDFGKTPSNGITTSIIILTIIITIIIIFIVSYIFYYIFTRYYTDSENSQNICINF